MGFFDRPQLPGAQPMPEPPGNDIARQLLLERMMQHNINPYGMSPEGASGINGPLFSTGLQPSPVFGQTSRGDVGDPFFRQSFLGGPQYAKGQSIWDRMGVAPPSDGSGSVAMSDGPRPMPALAGSRVALNSRLSPAGGGGGSVQSLLQMLMQIIQSRQGGGMSPQSFYNGRRVGTSRRFYDAIDRTRDNTDSPSPAPTPQPGALGSLLPQGTGGSLGSLDLNSGRRRPIRGDAGPLGGTAFGGSASRGSGGSLSDSLGGRGGNRPTHELPPRGGQGGGGSNRPYVRSEHAVNWGDTGPYSGTWQFDANGYPIGPGGFRYTGAQHEFSGGIGQQNVGAVNSATGGPSYAQWIEKVREIQGQKAKQNAADSLARREQFGAPETRSGTTDAARNWIMNHGIMGGHQPPVVDPGPGVINNTGTNPNSPV